MFIKQNPIATGLGLLCVFLLLDRNRETIPSQQHVAENIRHREVLECPQCVCKCQASEPAQLPVQPAVAAATSPSPAPVASCSAAPLQPASSNNLQHVHWSATPSCNVPGTKNVWEFFGLRESDLGAEEGAGGASMLQILLDHLSKAGVQQNKYAVNWGAHDGKSLDPIYPLYSAGWSGFAVELRDAQFADLQVNLHWDKIKKQKEAITPMNAVHLLDNAGAPRDMDLWKCDIDGYDLTVVQIVLGSGKYRPKVIMMEINEKVPPPIQFAVNYHTKYVYAGGHLYGMSLSAANAVLNRFNYRLVAVDWNNVIFVDGSYCALFQGLNWEEKAVYDAGYRNRPKRAENFNWNSNVDEWLTMDTHAALRAIQDHMIASDPYKNGNPSFTLHVDYANMPVCASP